jgi:hypothetical protein
MRKDGTVYRFRKHRQINNHIQAVCSDREGWRRIEPGLIASRMQAAAENPDM